MARRSTAIGLVGVFIAGLGATTLGGGGSTARAQTPGQDPPDARLDKRDRGWVSVSERVALGVEEPTWIKEHSKVHPDVRRALGHQKQVETNLEKERHWIDIVDREGPEAFLGYAYVVVHLEYSPEKEKGDSAARRASIRKLQDSVLSKLTAVDFRYWLRFPDHPAIIGFVNEVGLKKLAEDKDVRAVGLDAKPFPAMHESEARFYQQGSYLVDGVLPKVSPLVKAAFEKDDEVYVWVTLHPKEGQEERTVASFRTGRALNNRVLGQLSAQDFNVTEMSDETPYFAGWLTKVALVKVAEDTDVLNVGLPAPLPKVQGQGRKGP
jgi:hypothetical protein